MGIQPYPPLPATPSKSSSVTNMNKNNSLSPSSVVAIILAAFFVGGVLAPVGVQWLRNQEPAIVETPVNTP